MKPPTIRDVAERAGVSKSLVSLVLRRDPGVGPERKRAVETAMRELGYRPNRVARALAGNGTGAVGIVLNDLRNPWFVDLLAGLSTAFEPAGVAPLLVDSATNLRVGRSSIDILARQHVDGIVIVGTTNEGLDLQTLARGIPVVLAGTYDPDDIGADVVVNDDLAGGHQATQHLIELGHTSIACLRGPARVGELRAEGYRQAMTEAGLAASISTVVVDNTEDSGLDAARVLLADRDRPTALVVYNDVAALGAMAAAADLGLSAPDDVSIVGYDDTSLASMARVALTSVDNGTFAIGAQAAAFLLERIAGHDGPPRHFQVPSTLVVRSTTAPPPARKHSEGAGR